MILYKRVIKSEPITIQPDYSDFKSNILHKNNYDFEIVLDDENWMLKAGDIQITTDKIYKVIEILLLGEKEIDLPLKYNDEFQKQYLELFKSDLQVIKFNDYKDYKKIINAFEYLIEYYYQIKSFDDFETYVSEINLDGLVNLIDEWQKHLYLIFVI